jgi:hypothetical protein
MRICVEVLLRAKLFKVLIELIMLFELRNVTLSVLVVCQLILFKLRLWGVQVLIPFLMLNRFFKRRSYPPPWVSLRRFLLNVFEPLHRVKSPDIPPIIIVFTDHYIVTIFLHLHVVGCTCLNDRLSRLYSL